eukprot:COSAG01_NODE_34933_length_539_cov_2.870455_1_plen_70_part_00
MHIHRVLSRLHVRPWGTAAPNLGRLVARPAAMFHPLHIDVTHQINTADVTHQTPCSRGFVRPPKFYSKT